MIRLTDMLDDLADRKYCLRLEHYHSTMQWVAYYARQQQLSVEDAIESTFPGKDVWDFLRDTPEEAVLALSNEMEKRGWLK